MVDPGSPLGVGHLCPQLERELEVALGRRRCGRRVSGPARSDRRRQRARHVVRRQPVVGEHRAGVEVVAVEVVALLDRLRIRAVQLRAFAGEEVLVERGASERVAEVIATPGPLDHQQLLLDRLAQGVVQLRLG